MCRDRTITGRALAGVVEGDHVCCSFASDDEHRAVVARFATDAVDRGERLTYVVDRTPPEQVRGWLTAAGLDPDALQAADQLELLTADETYLAGGRFEPGRQLALVRELADAARADGFTGLAVTAEMSWALGDPGGVGALLEYERDVTAVAQAGGLRGLCQYDRRLFGTNVLAATEAVHPFTIEIDEHVTSARRGDVCVHEHAAGPTLSLEGELDLLTEPYLAARLAEHVDGDADVVLDAEGVRFIDVVGYRPIVRAALRLPAGRRVRVRNAPPTLRRLASFVPAADPAAIVLE